jgi:hypothetical protein
MANTGGKRIIDTFHFKHYAIPLPEITATNRITNATTRLTTAFASIQDAPLNNMEAIQSLCTLLIGEVAPLPPPTPSTLPTPSPSTPVVKEDEPIIIWNPQLVQSVLTSPNVNTDDIYSDHNTPALLMTMATMSTLSLVNIPNHLNTISFALCKTILSHAIN